MEVIKRDRLNRFLNYTCSIDSISLHGLSREPLCNFATTDTDQNFVFPISMCSCYFQLYSNNGYLIASSYMKEPEKFRNSKKATHTLTLRPTTFYKRPVHTCAFLHVFAHLLQSSVLLSRIRLSH